MQPSTTARLLETVHGAAKAQTALKIEAFARDLAQVHRHFGADAAQDAVQRTLQAPKTVIDGLLGRLNVGEREGEKLETRLAAYLHDHMFELAWFREHIRLAVRTLARHRRLHAGDDMDQLAAIRTAVESDPGQGQVPD